MHKVNIAEKLDQFSDHWNPRIIGQINDFHVRAVKLLGPFDWHHHDAEDEMFLVISGRLTMNFRDHTETISPGEFIIVPHGVEHQPVAEEEVQILLIERGSTVNTGGVISERTRTNLEHL
jgi:mannose-6-phosphate isomerase-like protein (cupin superfamily)